MRTLLAVASLVMLVGVGSGCGDDTTTATVDMATGMDLSAVAHDMAQLNCGQIFLCAQAAGQSAAALQQCLAEGKSTSQTKAQAVVTCAIGACSSDGGIDTTCVATTLGAALQATPAGPCASQGAACLSDM